LQINKLKLKNNNIDNKELLKLEKNYFETKQRYDSLTILIENKYPKYNQLINRPLEISIKDIQEKLVEGEVLIEYFYENDELYNEDKDLFIFLIRKNVFQIEKIQNKNLNKLISDFSTDLHQINFENYIQNSYSLYNILIEPVDHLLSGINKLIIIPDEELLSIPFEALIKNLPDNNNFYGDKNVLYIIILLAYG
ncbi:CHAT domain-containing protein, partial [Bacteroidota bacterium]